MNSSFFFFRNQLTLFPDSMFFTSIYINYFTLSRLFSILPISIVRLIIRPKIHPIPFHFISNIATFVLSVIRKSEFAFTFHLILIPITCIHSTICPFISSLTMNLIFVKFSFVLRFIRIDKFPPSMLLSIYIEPFKTRLVWPVFEPFPGLLIILSITNVFGFICKTVLSVAICLTLESITSVNRSVSMDYPSITILNIIFPVSFVICTIFPDLNTSSMFLSIFPLTLVYLIMDIIWT